MSLPADSREARYVLSEANKLAHKERRDVSSYDLLLGLYALDSHARELLRERHVVVAQLMRPAVVRAVQPEPAGSFVRLWQRAQEVALHNHDYEVTCLHLLVALTRSPDLGAVTALRHCGVDVMALRNHALAKLFGHEPRRAPAPAASRPSRTLNEGTHPALRESRRHNQGSEPAARPSRPRATGRVEVATLGPPVPIAATPYLREHVPAARTSPLAYETMSEPIGPAEPPVLLHPWPNDARPQLREPLEDDDNDDNEEDDEDDSDDEDLGETDDDRQERDDADSLAEDDAAALRPLAELAPALAECAVDLSERARLGELDPAIGRKDEIELVMDILGKRRANNPVLVGPPGVGKTAIVEGLARAWAGLDPAHAAMPQRRIVALDCGALVAGTSLRGSFSERMAEIKREVMQNRDELVVFIDELHTLIGAGLSGEGPQDAAQELKAALSRGEFPCIGATTSEEYRRYIERDAALERRFCAVEISEPDAPHALAMVQQGRGPYEAHHQVTYTAQALEAAVHLSERFVYERRLPDKAFAALDLAGARAQRRNKTRVEREDIAQVIHAWTQVPIARLLESSNDKLERAEALLGEQLVGHRHALRAIVRALRRGFAGLNGQRPLGSFLFVGPSGVGKTELTHVLAEYLFGRRDALVRIDMSEFSEKHAVARLLGAQPGYIGHEAGGQLTEAVRRRPFQLVLFDEVDKAHPDVTSVLLQLLDEGRLTDTQGRKVSFAQTVVILTSNAGAASLTNLSPTQRTKDEDDFQREAYRSKAAESFAPALWARLDAQLVFLPLSREELAQVATTLLRRKQRELERERKIRLEWTPEVIATLLAHSQNAPDGGARAIRRAIERAIDDPLATLLLRNELQAGSRLHVVQERHRAGLTLRCEAPRAAAPPPR